MVKYWMGNFGNFVRHTSAAGSASTIERGFHFFVRKAMMLEKGEELSAQMRILGLCATDCTRRKSALHPGVSSMTILSDGSFESPKPPDPPADVC